MKVFGFDPGRANTGMIDFNMDNKKVENFDTIELPIAKMRNEIPFNQVAHRLKLLQNAVYEFIVKGIERTKDMPLAVIEEYTYGDMGLSYEEFRKADKDVLGVGETHGAIMAVLAGFRIPYIKVIPSQMKYFITGNGHCTKMEIIKAMAKEYQVAMDDDHQYDALALVHIGRYFLAFCKNPTVITEGSYEYNVIVNIAYNQRYVGVSKAFGLNL